jgi:hypothetical protein
MFGLLALLSPIHLTPQSPPRHVLLIRRWGLGRLYSSLRMNAHPGSSANACDGLGEMSGPEPGGRGVFAEVVTKVGQCVVDVPMTC